MKWPGRPTRSSDDRAVRFRALLSAALVVASTGAVAAAPTLYSLPDHESPVRGGGDDLLMLGGHGFARTDRVVYAALGDTTRALEPPAGLPENSSSEIGYAEVVSHDDAPDSLTIRLPASLRREQSYALWVRTAAGEWSQGVEINDLRPLWITPAFVYASAPVASLPRALKLVGRNMTPSAGQFTQVRLAGPVVIALRAVASGSTIDEFVAWIPLPSRLPAGVYRVSASRDGRSWIDLNEQSLEVRPDPAIPPEFRVDDPKFGGCRADDGRDATPCVVRAIEAARANGAGTVIFGAGTWSLVNRESPGVSPRDGIPVPDGVGLRGMGSTLTRLVRGPDWNARSQTAAFSLLGHNVVAGFTFADSERYRPDSVAAAFLQVGENSDQRFARYHTVPPAVRDVVITHNRFDRPYVAIGDGGLAVAGLFVTYNEFGAYQSDLDLRGNVYNVVNRFRVDDSVIAHNLFKPGSFLQTSQQQGTIASQIGASFRVDFSDNTADGTAVDYLYGPDDAPGWRAGFFWSMNDSLEDILISKNSASCTGDKIGDGEAFALDNSANTFAFNAVRRVLAADRASVTVAGPLARRQHDRDVPVDSYYVGHWVQVGDGPGVGQVRKITAYRIDAATGRVVFTVRPNWDVTPAAGISRIGVGREVWQALVLDNHVDHRAPLCRKSNRSRAAGGSIGIWAQIADSVIAGNEQFDTDGIVFHETYRAPPLQCAGCGAETFFQSFVAIEHNLIDGKYDTTSDCAASGITGWISAAPGTPDPPPTLGYGIDVSRNRIVHADNSLGGAIAVAQSWYDGPPPHRFALVLNLILQHNEIDGIPGAVRGRTCNAALPRIGISFPGAPLTWRSVLYDNSCESVQRPLGSGGLANTLLCPDSRQHSCECLRSGAPR
jgi:hypothetical protein